MKKRVQERVKEVEKKESPTLSTKENGSARDVKEGGVKAGGMKEGRMKEGGERGKVKEGGVKEGGR